MDSDNWQELVRKIKAGGMRAGVALRPGTPIEEVFPLVCKTHKNLTVCSRLPVSIPTILTFALFVFEVLGPFLILPLTSECCGIVFSLQVESAEPVDMVLVMTVEPGFGGQSFMPETMPKVL